MVNTSELLLKTVTINKPKDAERLEPKGKWLGLRISLFLNVDVTPPVNRQDLTHSVIYAERGNPVVFLKGKASRETSRQDCGQRITEKAKAAM